MFENFNEFMMATKIHQEPGVYKRYGANPEFKNTPFHLEKRPEIGEDLEFEENNLRNMTPELEHSPYHMVLQNLDKIRKCLDCLDDICRGDKSKEAESLILNHAWMVDHVSTSADDLQESCDFMCSRLKTPNSSRESQEMPITISELGESAAYNFKNIRLDRL